MYDISYYFLLPDVKKTINIPSTIENESIHKECQHIYKKVSNKDKNLEKMDSDLIYEKTMNILKLFRMYLNNKSFDDKNKVYEEIMHEWEIYCS